VASDFMTKIELTSKQVANLTGKCPDCGVVHVMLVDKPGYPVGGPILKVILVVVAIAWVVYPALLPKMKSTDINEDWTFLIHNNVTWVLLGAGLLGVAKQLYRKYCTPCHNFVCTECGRSWRTE